MIETTHQHIPVMLQEVVETLHPVDGGIYVDGTFGAGGYTQAILNTADCTVYAIDRDPDAITRAQDMATHFDGRLIPLHGCFGDIEKLLTDKNVSAIDGFVLDLGVSSVQIDTPERGFSFMRDGPLDMRMSNAGESAADVVNTYAEKDIADIIYRYGDEKASRKIANAIITARKNTPIKTTKELTDIIHSVLPMHGGIKTNTATKTFQALRIFVNDELGELERALDAGEKLLADQGRFVIVSFHSLEDRRVKHFFREQSGKTANVSRHMPIQHADQNKTHPFHLPKDSKRDPTDDEKKINARSRSARLRYAIRERAGAHA